MSQDITDGTTGKTNGQAQEIPGGTATEKRTAGRSLYDQARDRVTDAYGHARDTIAGGTAEIAEDATATHAKAKDTAQGAKAALHGLASGDFGVLRDDLARLTQTIGEFLQGQAASASDEVAAAVGAAGENVAQSAAAAQDKLVTLEADLVAWVKKNPLSAVAVAAGLGFLAAKMTRFIK